MFFRTRISFFVVLAFTGAVLCFARPTFAATVTYRRSSQILVGTNPVPVTVFGGHEKNGVTIAAGDVNGDSVDEYVVASGVGSTPRIEVYDENGTKMASFPVFEPTMTAGLNVAAGDVNGDGNAEIVVAPQPGAPVRVEVYSMSGKRLAHWQPFDANNLGGAHVAVVPAHDGIAGSIAVASGTEMVENIKLFSEQGKYLDIHWQPYGQTKGPGVYVAAAWSTSENQMILVSGSGSDRRGEVKVYGLTTRTELYSWKVYGDLGRSGVRVAADSTYIATSPGPLLTATVWVFDHRGYPVSSSSTFESSFLGGASVALADNHGHSTPIVSPSAIYSTYPPVGKHIIVYLKTQHLFMVLNGQVVGVRGVSTGKASNPTPPGEYTIHNKIPVAYSKPFHLYMEWWMAFQADGSMGLHGLPFWKLKNGGKLYEGANHIGTPVSHGCVRETVANAKILYDWTPIGTPVSIRR